MDYQTLTSEITNGVAVITLNRPALMNALNTTMRLEITKAIKAAETEARCIVLTGAGKSFCSGQDLSDGGSCSATTTLAGSDNQLVRWI